MNLNLNVEAGVGRLSFKTLGVLAVAAIACAAFPVQIYLASMAVFGLPHVLSELGFVKSRFGRAAPIKWWLALGLACGSIAGAKLGCALGLWGAPPTWADLAALACALVVGACFPGARGWGRLCALGGAALAALCATGSVAALALIAVLALAHNFTPIVFGRALARQDPALAPRVRAMSSTFWTPLFSAVLASAFGAAGVFPFSIEAAIYAHGAFEVCAAWALPPLFAALACSQALHYWSVISVLPSMAGSAGPHPWTARPPGRLAWLVACAACGILLLAFMRDYGSARALYLSAAALHAWIEWPLLAAAFASPELANYNTQDKRSPT